MSRGVCIAILLLSCMGAQACSRSGVRPLPPDEGASVQGRGSTPAPPVERAPEAPAATPLARERWIDAAPRAPLRPPKLVTLAALRSGGGACRKVARRTRPAAPPGCSPDNALELLAGAVALDDPWRRDAALAELEHCEAWPAGLVSALRGDLLRACADVVLEPLLGQDAVLDAEIADAVSALHLAAQLGRIAKPSRALRGTDIEGYLEKVVRPWVAARKAELDAVLEQRPERLGGYAETVLWLARANTLRSLRAAVRGVRVPVAFRKEYEKRVRLYGGIDAELAELMKLRDEADIAAAAALSRSGVRRAPDADRWWAAASPRFVRRLALETVPIAEPETAAELIASRLPAFYASRLLGKALLEDRRLLPMLAARGLEPEARRTLTERGADWQKEILVEYRAAMARRTLDGVHWDEVVRLVSELQTPAPRAELASALALALRRGPRSLAEARRDAAISGMDLGPLERFAEGDAPPRPRAFALVNALWLSAFSKPPLPAAHGNTFERAKRLSPDKGTLGCVRRLEQHWSLERAPPCNLPSAP